MKTNKRYCQLLDLVDDPKLIEEYKQIHQNIWPEVEKHIKQSGILNMQIWHLGNRLFMIMDVDKNFSFENAAQMEKNNPTIQTWEQLMWKYQKPTPWTPQGQKWVLMEKIFDLDMKV